MGKLLSASIPEDLKNREVDSLTVAEIKEIVRKTGISKILSFTNEKKKAEIEQPPTLTGGIIFPFVGLNEKKKLEYEVPIDIFNAEKGIKIADLLDRIQNEWKKAAMEVDDLLSQIKVFEENFITRLRDVISEKELR